MDTFGKWSIGMAKSPVCATFGCNSHCRLGTPPSQLNCRTTQVLQPLSTGARYWPRAGHVSRSDGVKGHAAVKDYRAVILSYLLFGPRTAGRRNLLTFQLVFNYVEPFTMLFGHRRMETETILLFSRSVSSIYACI